MDSWFGSRIDQPRLPYYSPMGWKTWLALENPTQEPRSVLRATAGASIDNIPKLMTTLIQRLIKWDGLVPGLSGNDKTLIHASANLRKLMYRQNMHTNYLHNNPKKKMVGTFQTGIKLRRPSSFIYRIHWRAVVGVCRGQWFVPSNTTTNSRSHKDERSGLLRQDMTLESIPGAQELSTSDRAYFSCTTCILQMPPQRKHFKRKEKT